MTNNKLNNEHSWHALSLPQAFDILASSEQGLSERQVEDRLIEFGKNKLSNNSGRGPIRRFFSQFHNVLIYVLLLAAIVTAVIELWIDSGVIFGVVLINAIIGFIQEGKAEKAIDAIRNMLTLKAIVRRDQTEYQISAEQLVPGDIVKLESGDKVPADLRLLLVKNLKIDESILTGESVPVEKNIIQTDQQTLLADRLCMAYSGTLVTYGTAEGLVVATGDATEIGRISSMLSSVSQLTTPLVKQIAHFSRWLTFVILVLAAATFAYGWYVQHSSIKELFMSAVGLAVSAIPEGLPAIMTITLAIGVQRMARRNAIVRRLPAVETLGSVSVICTDKTGTLTRNEMTVKSVFTSNQEFFVDGVGYEPYGDFKLSQQSIVVTDHPDLESLIRAAVLCNNASLEYKNNQWTIHGDPTEAALVTLACKAGLDPDAINSTMTRIDSIPFESENRFMATLHTGQNNGAIVFVKGAPEKILSMCGLQSHHDLNISLDKDYWFEIIKNMAGRGQRLLAIAVKPINHSKSQISVDDIKSDLILLGVVGMIDPPRPEAIAAVEQCKEAGIRVIMITGDHSVTAMAVAEQIKLTSKGVLTGEDVDKLNDKDLSSVIHDVDIFARTSPENKLRLVSILQALGHIVAMTGDGVNDAPALKRAEVGVSMGMKGTEVAKETSEMVLADDNFASIVHAVEEGRGIYDNLKKSIIFILPTSGGEALTIIAAIVLGKLLPITPVQILWVNMVTTVTLALTLAFERPERNIMQRLPRDANEPLLSKFLVWRTIFVSLVIVAGTFGLFLWEQQLGYSIQQSRTVAVNALVGFEMFYVFNSRYLTRSILNWHGLFGNVYIWLAVLLLTLFQLAFTYWQPMQRLFGTEAIDWETWGLIVIVSSSVFFLVEFEKILFALFRNRKVHVAH